MQNAHTNSIIFNIHPYAMHMPGGGEIQLLKYRHYLSEHGCEVLLHDIWRPQLETSSVFHHFHLISGSLPFLDYVKKLGMTIVISPNLWINDTNYNSINQNELRSYFEYADLIICNSRLEIQNLTTYAGMPVSKSRVVYNGVDNYFSDLIDESVFRSWAKIEGPFLLSVANIEPRKNQIASIKAAETLRIPLVSIGRIRDSEYYKLCLKCTNGKYFKYMGPLDQSDLRLRAAYQSCSAFIMPSTLETPSIAALEAAAAGAKIVITKEGSSEEYFLDHAFYVDPNDQSSVLSGVNNALNAPVNKSLSERVRQNFSWSIVANDLLKMYNIHAD